MSRSRLSWLLTTRWRAGATPTSCRKHCATCPAFTFNKRLLVRAHHLFADLTGQQVLHLINGVRFNNSTFRPGANQYTALIDHDFADRVEVVRGPGSTQYGSDSLGGTINVLTRSAQGADSFGIHGNVNTFFASADLSARLSTKISGSSASWGFLFGASGRRTQDLAHRWWSRFPLRCHASARHLFEFSRRQAAGHCLRSIQRGREVSIQGFGRGRSVVRVSERNATRFASLRSVQRRHRQSAQQFRSAGARLLHRALRSNRRWAIRFDLDRSSLTTGSVTIVARRVSTTRRDCVRESVTSLI